MSRIISLTMQALLLAGLLLGKTHSACLGDPKAAAIHTVHIVPQFPPSVLMVKWAPLLERLGREAHLCFEIRIEPTIPAFENALRAGLPDFAFANPYHGVVAKRTQGYLPLVVDHKELLSGIVVVRNDSPIKDIRQLGNQDIAFPAPNAFAASLLIRSQLLQQGIRIQPQYVKSHANVYRAVILGDVAAGGGVNNTLERENPSVRAQLRVLYKTPGYTPHPFVAHPRVAAPLREAVIQAFLKLGRSDEGIQLLNVIQIPEPVRADYARDFTSIEALQLDEFVVSNEKH